jgi:uncharacterized OB-fold protein
MSDMEFTNTTYMKAIGDHKLVGSRCKFCGQQYFPARPMCPECHGRDMEAVELSGRGTLAAYSVINIATTAMIQAGYDRKNPYCTGVVHLEEGPRICAQIIGVDVAHPAEIKIGTPVTATFLERGEGEAKKTFLGFQV